jgi:hypothetical protein
MPATEYAKEYHEFMSQYKLSLVSAEEIGVQIMRLAWHFTSHNARLMNALKRYSVTIRDFQNSMDQATGKPMSSAKAESLSAATEEAAQYEEEKIHIQNIEQMMNALKSLQKGRLQEYSNAA